MEATSKNTPNNPEISPEQLSELVQDFLVNQKSFKDLQGITDKEMEAIYATAYNFYSHGKFDRAKSIFLALSQLDHYQPKYWVGLGASRQMLKEYQPAIDAYGLAMLLDPNDPKPAFYASNCFMRLAQHDKAILALEAVIEVAEDNPDHKDIRSQAENLLEGLRKKEVPKKEVSKDSTSK